MAVRYAITGGTWSSTSTWNNGASLGIPTTGDDVYTNGFTVNMDVNATVISLNNVAKSIGSKATPNMTSNGSPSGQVISSNNSINAFRAFDGQNSFTSGWQGGAATGWVGYISDSPFIVTRYILQQFDINTYGGGNGNGPTSWNLEGSNDGITWNIVHTASFVLITNQTYQSPLFSNPTSYSRYRINVLTSNGGTNVAIGEINLYVGDNSITLSSGGNFNFNTSGVSVNTTSVGQSTSNIFIITNTGGTTSLSIANNIGVPNGINVLTHSSNGDFIVTSPNFIINNTGGTSRIVSKSGAGQITMNGNLIMGTGTNSGAANYVLESTNGNTIINGDIIGFQGTGAGSATALQTIRQTSGNLTINGSVSPITLGGFNAGYCTILFQGTTFNLNGNTLGNNNANIITTGTVNVNGEVSGGNAIFANSTITINVVVNLTGNMFNNLGRMAIWCPNIFISNSTTTLWRMDIGGGLTRTLYSADSFPNLPSTSNVRNLVQYGPASGLTGTMVVASPSDIRRNVLTDNTVGTANITAQDILNFINTSSDPLAVRMRTMLTDNSAGQLISEYNFV